MADPLTVAALRRALPDDHRLLLRAATAEAEAAGWALWAVGGVVRDLFGDPVGVRVVDHAVEQVAEPNRAPAPLPTPQPAPQPTQRPAPPDLDLALADEHAAAGAAGRAAALAHAVADRLAGRGRTATVRVEPRFLTASVLLAAPSGRAAGPAARLDIATLRTERYPRAAALPVIRPTAAIEEDLLRRDFTVNALALGLSGAARGRFVDPAGGAADLRAGRLRLLHDRSLRDDPTRLWRAARYAARLDLRPDDATAALLAAGARWLPALSGERLWGEWTRLAGERRSLHALRLLDRWGVLAGTAPGWRLAPAAEHALRHRPGPHGAGLLLAVSLAPLPAAVRAATLARLRPPADARAAVSGAARLLDAAPRGAGRAARAGAGAGRARGAARAGAGRAGAAPDPALLEALAGAPPQARRAAAWLDPDAAALARALTRWERTRPPLDGRDLVALGVPPGPRIGELLRRLRRERYFGTLRTERAARRAVRRWLGEE